MAKRRYDPEAAREAILDSAERLFADKGFGDVSTSAIGREAGVSQSQIHYHFETKRKLWEAVFQRRFAAYFQAQSATLSRTDFEGAERMAISIRDYFRFFQNSPSFVKLMARANLEPVKHKEPMSSALVHRGVEVIREGQQGGALRDDVPAEFILLGFLSLVASWFQYRDRYVPETGLRRKPPSYDAEYLDFILKIYLQGIAPGQKVRK